jgi:hypothetical protein
LIAAGIVATAITVLTGLYGSRMVQPVVPRVEQALSVQDGVVLGVSALAVVAQIGWLWA